MTSISKITVGQMAKQIKARRQQPRKTLSTDRRNQQDFLDIKSSSLFLKASTSQKALWAHKARGYGWGRLQHEEQQQTHKRNDKPRPSVRVQVDHAPRRYKTTGRRALQNTLERVETLYAEATELASDVQNNTHLTQEEKADALNYLEESQYKLTQISKKLAHVQAHHQKVGRRQFKHLHDRMDVREEMFDTLRKMLEGNTNLLANDEIADKLKNPKVQRQEPPIESGTPLGPHSESVGRRRPRLAREITDITSTLIRGDSEVMEVREYMAAPSTAQLLTKALSSRVTKALQSIDKQPSRQDGGSYTKQVHAREANNIHTQTYAALDRAMVRVNEESIEELAQIEQERAASLEQLNSSGTTDDFPITNTGQAIQALNGNRDAAFAAISTSIAEGIITTEQGQEAMGAVLALYTATKTNVQTPGSTDYESVLTGFDRDVAATLGGVGVVPTLQTVEQVHAFYDSKADAAIERTYQQTAQLEAMKDNLSRVEYKAEQFSSGVLETAPQDEREAQLTLNTVEELMSTKPQSIPLVEVLFGDEPLM